MSLRDDLTTVPLEGVDPTRVVVVTRPGDHHPLVTAFRECARTNLVPAQPEF